MRRILTITLIAVFGWVFAAPLLPAVLPSLFASTADDANLPACCRRSGKHHCEAQDRAVTGTSDAAFPGIGRLADKCPYPPRANPAVPPFSPLTIVDRPTAEAVPEQPHPLSQVEAEFRIAAGRSHQKRGPPSATA